VYGSNTRNLYGYLYLKLAKMLFLIISYVFSPTKLEKREEQVLPGSGGGGGKEAVEMGHVWERWPKQCVYI
jgi:hypothetical protein